MRAWLSPQTGTGGRLVVPVGPYTDEDGNVQTEAVVADPIRAEHMPEREGFGRPISRAPRFDVDPIWVVIDFVADDAPVGALDMGDPLSPGWASTLLTFDQKVDLRSRLGGTVAFWDQDRTRGGILALFLDRPARLVSRRLRQAVTIGGD